MDLFIETSQEVAKRLAREQQRQINQLKAERAAEAAHAASLASRVLGQRVPAVERSGRLPAERLGAQGALGGGESRGSASAGGTSAASPAQEIRAGAGQSPRPRLEPLAGFGAPGLRDEARSADEAADAASEAAWAELYGSGAPAGDGALASSAAPGSRRTPAAPRPRSAQAPATRSALDSSPFGSAAQTTVLDRDALDAALSRSMGAVAAEAAAASRAAPPASPVRVFPAEELNAPIRGEGHVFGAAASGPSLSSAPPSSSGAFVPAARFAGHDGGHVAGVQTSLGGAAAHLATPTARAYEAERAYDAARTRHARRMGALRVVLTVVLVPCALFAVFVTAYALTCVMNGASPQELGELLRNGYAHMGSFLADLGNLF